MTTQDSRIAPDVAPRPRPLRRAASVSGATPALGGTAAVTVLVAAIISRGQADPTTLAIAGATVLAAAGTVVATVLRTIRAGEREVTPTRSPRGPDGAELVPRRDADLADVLIAVLTGLQDLQADQQQVAQHQPASSRGVARDRATATLPPVVRDTWTAPPERQSPAREPASTRLAPPATGGRHASRRRRADD